MRVAVDATPLALSSGGLARYTSELVQALARLFPDDEYLLLSDQKFRTPLRAPQNVTRGFGPGGPLERRWWLWGLPREMSRLGAQVFHGTNFAVPYFPARPSVMTLHDLSPWMDEGWHSGADRVRRLTPALIRLGCATMIIVPSDAVRRQTIERFRVHSERIVAVPEAASAHFERVDASPGERPFFLFVGTLEPRKNLRFLVDAWRPVRELYGVDLALAGRRREDFAGISEEPGLRVLGEVPERDLPRLYSQALAFVYPSLYEGFGLPVLEAMQCGACVITSDDPAIGEVAGEAATRLDPRDGRAWTEALMACAAGGEWVARQKAKALARARCFSWERTARRTHEIYLQVYRRFHG